MSDAYSISVKRRFGRKLICKHVGKPRSTHYYRSIKASPSSKQRPGPKLKVSDLEILAHAQRLLRECPFLGEGYRKLHSRLRFDDILVGKDRLLRILRENDMLAKPLSENERGPRHHTGTIGTERPDEMWGTDFTFTQTDEDGSVAVFITVDHFNTECLGIHAAKSANRFEALEPVKQAVVERFGSFEKDIVKDLKLRHDHGTQYTSRFFQKELKWCGVEKNPSFVRQPEGNGISERFIKTLKEQLLWINRYKNVEELREALHEFKKKYNEQWLLGRHKHQTPRQVYEKYVAGQIAA